MNVLPYKDNDVESLYDNYHEKLNNIYPDDNGNQHDEMFKFMKNGFNIDEDYEEDEIKNSVSVICVDDGPCELITSNGISVCKKCGKMSEKIIEHNAEWRYYGSDDSKSSDPTRCGMPTNFLLKESSLGSAIAYGGINNPDMAKIRKYHIWNAMPYKERSLYNVFDAISVRSINSGIPACIIEDAKENYKLLDESQISRGSNRKGLIAACIYNACKKRCVPRSAKEIAKIFNLNITNMTRGCKHFMDIMNMHKKSDMNTAMKSTKPGDFVDRFCSNINISDDLKGLCVKITNKVDEYSLVSSNTPPSVAAGCIYMICNFCKTGITKKDISQTCGISEVTISKCYKKISEYKKVLFSKQERKFFNIK